MGEFRMPSLGADMEAGTILEWRVHAGDAVHRGDIVAVVDTEKSDIEVEVFEDGVVDQLLVEEGVQVPVGTPLAMIRGPGSSTVTAPAEPEPALVLASPDTAPSNRTHREFVRSSPLARRLAAAAGVDLANVRGSGPGGAIRAADVEASPAPPPAATTSTPPGSAGRDPDAMRHAIGALMARSKREIPHYYLGTTIDLTAALEWMTGVNEQRPVTERLLPAALLLRATALAVADVPAMNGTYTDRFTQSPSVHLGVAIALRGGGLVAPAIHDAQDLGVLEVMTALRDLVERARAGRLRGSEMSDPTITVTNLGDQGVEEVYGVIYPPQVAIVGFGAVARRPWVGEGDAVSVRSVVRASLSGDHRASDGHDGARFLSAIDRLLQHPEDL